MEAYSMNSAAVWHDKSDVLMYVLQINMASYEIF